jgi:hypothetical protein
VAPDRFLRFPDPRAGTCREAHEAGYCLGWCELPEELMPPLPLWDVPCPGFRIEEFEPAPMKMPAGLIFFLDSKYP